MSGQYPAGADPTALPLFAEPPVAANPWARAQAQAVVPTRVPRRGRVGAAGHGPTSSAHSLFTSRAGAAPGQQVATHGPVDWALVAALRSEASNRMTAAISGERTTLSRDEQRELGRSIIQEMLEAAAAEDIARGRGSWTLEHQERLAVAVFDALFGLGRLQPLVDDDRVENIQITGCDRVTLELTDGSSVRAAPVAESDEELIEFLVFLASRSEVNARTFSEAQPELNMRLDGGARLAATAWVTPRPSVTIRRHRLLREDLDGLVDRGMLSPLAASFLRAAVRGRRNIVVSGSQGAGKTTLVRALCAEIPPWEVIGTFETDYELHLHEMPDRHPVVHAWESRPGSGEKGADGRMAGEYTLDQALYASFRYHLTRQIVGEVRGHEILAMLKAMASGSGSISTTHARDAHGAIGKLVTCALEAGPHVTRDFALRLLAENLDLVVHVDRQLQPGPDGRLEGPRFVAEVLAVQQGEQEAGFASTHVFKASPRSRVATARVLPEEFRELAWHGFDVDAFHAEAVRSGEYA